MSNGDDLVLYGFGICFGIGLEVMGSDRRISLFIAVVLILVGVLQKTEILK